MDRSEQDHRALQDFIVGNAELEKLEALLDRFNIFEAVGMERQEIRHSRFLAFLLDPNESHGMGDAFVKRLLQRAVMDAPHVSSIRQVYEALVNEHPDLIIDHAAKGRMQFAVKDWDTPVNLSGSDWTASGRILMFEIVPGVLRPLNDRK